MLMQELVQAGPETGPRSPQALVEPPLQTCTLQLLQWDTSSGCLQRTSVSKRPHHGLTSGSAQMTLMREINTLPLRRNRQVGSSSHSVPCLTTQ